MAVARPKKSETVLTSINGVKLDSSSDVWDIEIYSRKEISDNHDAIKSITPHRSRPGEGERDYPLILPALTHPHIHLDKAFIHSHAKYANLRPSSGSFSEALSLTTQVKQKSDFFDFMQRGEWLIAESVAAGVTAMRAFVEIDHTVKLEALKAADELSCEWNDVCHIQIVGFAQDPLFSGDHGEENRRLLEMGIKESRYLDVIGSTPYVESSVEASKENIEWAIDRALHYKKHVDFHLDYNLDATKEPLIWHVLNTLLTRGWTSTSNQKRVMLGHCTRLTLLTDQEWSEIAQFIHKHDLPVSFVGLPTSDLYMAAPPTTGTEPPHQRPRGTLHVPDMIRKHNLDAVMGINNVGNAFTPWGSTDPLGLACLGVGIYQAGTQADAALLYECVSTRARAAIGLTTPTGKAHFCPTGHRVKVGGPADLIIFPHYDDTGCGAMRPRRSVAEVVWDPPIRTSRTVIAHGYVQLGGPSQHVDMSKFEFKPPPVPSNVRG